MALFCIRGRYLIILVIFNDIIIIALSYARYLEQQDERLEQRIVNMVFWITW